MGYVEVLKISDLPEGSLRTIKVEDREVTVTRVGLNYYAFDDTCSHKKCSLGEGFLEGTTIECPCHGAKFDIASGQVKALPATEPIKTYPIRLEGDTIFIGV